jgi:hypothetical protein
LNRRSTVHNLERGYFIITVVLLIQMSPRKHPLFDAALASSGIASSNHLGSRCLKLFSPLPYRETLAIRRGRDQTQDRLARY